MNVELSTIWPATVKNTAPPFPLVEFNVLLINVLFLKEVTFLTVYNAPPFPSELQLINVLFWIVILNLGDKIRLRIS